jgi:hypothetical protein
MSSRNEQVEIDEIIEELNKQMLSISENFVGVGIRNYTRQKTPKSSTDLSALFMPEKFKALAVVWTTDKPHSKQIAEWIQDEEGYPVKIIWKNVAHTCTNRDGLEQMLMKIVADASFGIIVRDIIYDNGKKIVNEDDGPKVASSDHKKKATRKPAG